jgi:hypothetical protein
MLPPMSEGPPSPAQQLEVPPRDLAIPPAPLRPSGGGSFAALVVLVVVIAVITAGVVTANVAPPNPRASIAPPVPHSAAPSSQPPASVATSGPDASSGPIATSDPVAIPPVPGLDASAILARTTPRLSRDRLAAGVLDGSLEGRLVFVDGVMRATPARCIDPALEPLGCVDLEIPGLGLPVTPGDSALPWPGEPPPGAWLVTVARGAGLVYLGSLVPWRDGPWGLTSIRMLLANRGGVPPHGSLFEVDGFLARIPSARGWSSARNGGGAGYCVTNPLRICGSVGPDATLSDAGEEVVLTGSVPGVEPGAVVMPGPFLVVPVEPGGSPWRIVARYEPARSVRVLVP